MISLLNRLSWLISIMLGTLLTYVFFGREFSYGGDSSFVMIIIGTIFGLIIKRLFLGESLITQRVITYTNKVVERAKRGESVPTEPLSVDLQQEIVSHEQQENADMQTTESDAEIKAENAPAMIAENPKQPKEPSFLERFFAENALAKIGGILLFLGVLFFLGLVYSKVGAVGKLVIGFLAGFSFFGIGIVLDRKGYEQESRTLLGLGILVNYLVILSGRYLIGEGNVITETDIALFSQDSKSILTEGTTFFFLILNTIFAVVTSLVYRSKTLLMFSFVFAYLNPFLIGSAGDGTPFTLVLYSAAISIGALSLSHIFYRGSDGHFARYMSITGFIGGNILFVLAPISSSGHWVFKLFFLAIISMLTLMMAYKNNEKNDIGVYFIGAYIAFMFMLFAGGDAGVLKTPLAFISYLLFLGLMLAYCVFFITAASLSSLGSILFAPLIFVFFLLITGSLFMVVPVILGILLAYLLVFAFVAASISNLMKHIFFILLSVFLLSANISIGLGSLIELDRVTHTSILIAGFIFLYASYHFSRRDGLAYLFTIGNIGTILLLLPIIQTKGELMTASIIAVSAFIISNAIAPFIIGNLRKHDLMNLSISLVFGILFAGWELYNFGAIAKLFPGVPLGYSFLGLAVAYFALGSMMMRISGEDLSEGNTRKESAKNAIYTYLGISISLFSLAALIIFSTRPAVVASIWFFESTILFFFSKRLKDIRIYLSACLLFAIGVIKYSSFIPTIESKDLISLIPLMLVGTSLMLNLHFLKDDKDQESRVIHDILHMIGLVMIGAGVANIVPHTGQGYTFLALSAVFIIVGTIYDKLASAFLRYAFMAFLGIFYISHIFSIGDIFYVLQADNKENLKSLQYITMIIPGIWMYARNGTIGRFESSKILLLGSYLVYLFISSTIFIYDISDDNVFSITIYWAIWAFFYLSHGIRKDLQKWRTIGLYILTLVLAKILLYDVWFGINDAILRVVALMFVGGSMIYISTMYTRKYPGNLLREFNMSNLAPDNGASSPMPERGESYAVNENIKDVDIGELTAVTFELIDGKRYLIRSKNLIRISKLIEKKFGRSDFLPGELKDYFEYISQNYKSELSDSDYKKILGAIREFVDIGGKISFS